MKAIGIIGGTGELGCAIATHLARHYSVFLGSRNRERANVAVKKILLDKENRDYLVNNLRPVENKEAVEVSDLTILTIPNQNAVETVSSLVTYFSGDKILISAVAPVVKTGREFYTRLGTSNRSVSQQISEIVPKTVRVASAFQSVPAHILYEEKAISCDVLVACDEIETYQRVSEVISNIDGLRPLYLGSLNLSSEVERLTAIILNVAVNNRLKSPTIKFNSF